MDSVLRFTSQFMKGFDTLSPQKRIIAVLIALGSIMSVILLVYFMNQQEYSVLYSHLTAEDAGSIIERIKEKKVLYKLSSSGDTIMVPEKFVSELRLELATLGLPQGGMVGFEIFDKKNIGVTEFVQHLNFQRALQGELARTISSIDEIQQARVHIVMPKKSLFVEEKSKTTASVVLKLKPARKLTVSQIEGIAHLVSSSVEDLEPGAVMVVDNRGDILSSSRDESRISQMTQSQTVYQRNIEKELSDRIQHMLEKVVGRGSIVAKVSATLDFRVTEKTEEIYDSEEPAIRSMHRKTENAGDIMGGGASTVDVPQNSRANGYNKKREKTDEVVNYEINRTVSKTVMPVGDIKRLSVAVLVDGVYRKNEKGVDAFSPRSKKELSTLEELVKKATGFNAKRGDQVTVTSVPFRRAEEDMPLIEESLWKKILIASIPFMKYLLIFLAVAAVILLVLRPLARTVASSGEGGDISFHKIPLSTAGQLETAEPAPVLEEPAEEELDELSLLRHMAAKDDRKFAELMRYWMK